jgi:hypothetical protein
VDNIKMDLGEIGCGGIDWIDMAQDRGQWNFLVNRMMIFRIPQNIGKFLSSCTTGSFSRGDQLYGVG